MRGIHSFSYSGTTTRSLTSAFGFRFAASDIVNGGQVVSPTQLYLVFRHDFERCPSLKKGRKRVYRDILYGILVVW